MLVVAAAAAIGDCVQMEAASVTGQYSPVRFQVCKHWHNLSLLVFMIAKAHSGGNVLSVYHTSLAPSGPQVPAVGWWKIAVAGKVTV